MEDADGSDPFEARAQLKVGDRSYDYFRLDVLPTADDLPYSLKVLLENVLRCQDGVAITPDQVTALAQWQPISSDPPAEIQFTPARVLLQDFTGVPCVVDLVAMRDAVAELGGDPALINPGVPAELVIDHSVIADVFGRPDAFARNAELEFERNQERYQLLRWGQQAFDNFLVVPPDTGICHQVNLEYLARCVFTARTGDRVLAYPDTLVGTDSHTPMINGLGVLGWGVGGIEAEAALLGQPVSMLVPPVLGLKLEGELVEGVTATDLVLTVAELLRRNGVVGKFVDVHGPGVANVPLAVRATLGNMSPEYGSTCTIFPIDQVTLDYLRLTGRSEEQIALVEAYAKQQGLWHRPDHTAKYSQTLELDLGSVVPSIAGPTRPQDRVPLSAVKHEVRSLLSDTSSEPANAGRIGLDNASYESFPASDPIAVDREHSTDKPTPPCTCGDVHQWRSTPVQFEMGGAPARLDNGDVVIAAITSCTNTSNPSVMIAAGLVAKRAVERGLRRKPWVKTSLAPGSRVVMDYLSAAGLLPYLERLGFNLVGYGCTTCIGNSGPLPEPVAQAVSDGKLDVASVLSGNRNFEGRIHPQSALNFLASPPLVVVYALTGTMHVDLIREPIGQDHDGRDVYLSQLWPTTTEIDDVIAATIGPDQFTAGYSTILDGDDRWNSMDLTSGDRFEWRPDSTYVRSPTFLTDMALEPDALTDVEGARVLAHLGDSVTTDHISPAGSIAADSPAGNYLREHGVQRRDFNSYGSRRGNHEVMMRGTFANIRLRNKLVPDVQGGFTRHLPGTAVVSIYDAAMAYAEDNVPLIVIAGADYGSGSSRDWAAKGTLLLGVKAVLAKSFERIHRSNLIGMGVLPLQFASGDSAESLGLTGEEIFSISGLRNQQVPPSTVIVEAVDGDRSITFEATVRIDTPVEAQYFRHGGILPYVVRQLVADHPVARP